MAAAVGLEHVEFFKAAFVKQKINPFTRGHAAFCVQFVNTFLAAAHSCFSTELQKVIKGFLHSVLSVFVQNSIKTPWVD